ncbi:hypothetical protein ISF_07925 [Cordyceps fumosorosea ARSEF 2679]|uniref:Uncharacterized protein n=1 Tax=Cordyceps fumosorosea (strain ARSEF 2679) TaxID=1081104 RepID=A0A167ND25_CORFA|nr:hypothetical protein ISF_07925 [Cordyceps fumosorosea ARSEF 2679]OAA55414.1 hypothetical protein ISF_07925 [Cordyceps fumosorosea ARSEF 2679]
MKFHAAALLLAATARAAAVEASDFSDLDAFLANVPTSALRAAQSSIAAGVQPTTTAPTAADTSAAAALEAADDGLPSESEIDALIASAAAEFGSAQTPKNVPGAVAARDAATVTVDPEAAAAATEALKGLVAAVDAVKSMAAVTAASAATTATGGLVVDGRNSSSASATPTAVLTAAAPRHAVSGLAIAGMLAAYLL